MSPVARCIKVSAAICVYAFLGAREGFANSGAWEGDTSLFWTNSNNWANNATYPSAGETATFNSTGNNRTNINIAGLSRIKYITFDSYNVGPYIIGTVPANSQTIVMENDANYRLNANVANSQIFSAAVQIGTDRAAATYYFQNDSPSYALTMAGDILTPSSGGTAGGKTITINGVGNVRFLGNILTNGQCQITLDNNSSGTLTLTGSNRVSLLRIDGAPNSVIDIGDNGYLFLDNLGGNTINATMDGVITGRGKIRLSTNTGHNYADNYVAPGKTLVINPDIIGETGFEMWSGTGTFVFNGINTFESNVIFGTSGTISVSKIGNKGSTTSNLGQGTTLRFASGRLLYTGVGETSDRLIQMENSMILDHSGTGELVFSSDFNVLGNTKTLTLQGSTAGIGELSGIVSNGSATTSLTKDGTGTWRLSAANSFAGSTTVRDGALVLTGANGAITNSSGYTVNNGATLRLANAAAANNGNRLKDSSGVTLNGGSLHFSNDGGAASYSETAAALSVAQNACTVRADRAPTGQTSTLTFSSLSRTVGATVDFEGEGLGDPDGRNKIVFTTAPTLVNGVIGPWATVNGTNLATYSVARGVYASPLPAYDVDIAARGPASVIASNDTQHVRINSDGVAGAIQLGSPVTRIASLTQNTATEATVDTAGKSFQTAAVAVPAGKAPVVLGASSGDGTLSALVSGGDLTLGSDAAGGMTVNAVIANNGSASTLTKQGSGPVTLAAPNTFSGVTSIGGGTLRLTHADALQNSTLGGAGAVFDSSVASHAFAIGGLTGSFPLPLEDNGGSPVNLTLGRGNPSATYSGMLSGLGGLTKTGTATQTLSGSNTFSGGVTLSQGALSIGNASSLGVGPVVNNGTLNLTAGGVTYSGLSSSLSGTGTVNVTLTTGSGTTFLHGDYSGFTGIWNLGIGASANAAKAYMNGLDNSAATINVLSNASLYCNNVGTHTAKLVLKGGNTGEPYGQLRLENNCVWAGPVTLAGPITSGEDGTVGGSSGTGFITGTISDLDSTPRPLYKIGVNTIALSGANTYKGPTWIRNGTLRISSIANVGAASSALGAPQNVADGTLKFGENNTNTVLVYVGNGDESDRKFELAGTTGGATLDHSGTNLLKLTGSLSSTAAGVKKLTLQGSSAVGDGEFAGVISDGVAGSQISVIKAGSGKWILSNANTFSGGVTNSGGGVLEVAHPNALGTAGVAVFNGGVATYDLAHDGVGETVNDWWLYSGANCTIRSNRGTEGEGINHTLGTVKLSGVTLTVTNGLKVTSGTPSLTLNTVDLFSGGADTIATVIPVGANLIIGRAAIYENSFANKTLKLDGTSTGNVVLGAISNGLNTVKLIKSNTGTWTLYGSNTFSGATAVDNGLLAVEGPDGALLGAGGITLSTGARLLLKNNSVTNNGNRLSDSAIVTMKGGVLEYAHAGGAANYSETAGPLSVQSGSNTIATARADASQTSTLTFASLARTGGTVNFAGEGVGGADGRNRILFSSAPTLANGLIGPWAVINGSELATYDGTLGVTPYTGYADLAARGPDSVITNDATLNARINLPGTDGPITLGTSPISQVYTLLQNSDTPATVTTTGTTFQASAIVLGAGKASLTIGAAQGDGALTALAAGGELTLANHDATALLTVNAPVTNNASASSLAKSGVGTVVLTGSNTYSGATAINEGTLAFGGTGTQTVSSVISGPGKLAKRGSGRLTLSAANTFTGETYIEQGIVVAQNNAAFGSSVSGTFISDGATLDIGSSLSTDALNLGAEVFTVSGSGVDGQGAIVNGLPTRQLNSFGRIVLAGDATVGAVGRWDIRQNSPSLTLNGHTFTKIGTNEFCIVSAQVYPGSGHMVTTQGVFRLESSTRLNGDASNTLRVKSGAKLDLYSLASASNATPWTLITEPLAWVTAGNSFHPLNTWWGPVTLEGTTFLDGSSGRSVTFSNTISGAGSLVKNGTGEVFVFGNGNTYAGTTSISNGLLHIMQPGGLPGYDAGNRVAIGPSGTLVTYFADDGSGWTLDQIEAVRTNAAYGSILATLGINTSWGHLTYAQDLTQAMSFAKFGTNTLTFPQKNLFGGSLKVYGGTVNLPASSTNAIGAVTVNGGTLGATLNVDGFTSLSSGTANMTLGSSGNDRSVVTFSTNAVMAKLLVGTTKGGSGAVIQNGGNLTVGDYIISTDVLSVGTGGGYGYYRMNAGSLRTGQLGITGGGAGNNDGVFEVFNGSINVCTNGGWLIWGWAGGSGVLNMFGGSISSPINGNDLTMAYTASRDCFAMLNLLGPTALVDSTGQNTGKSVNMARSAGNIASVFNLNAGTLLANRVFASVTGTPTLFNFNGGKLKVNTSTTYATTFLQGLTAATVYSGGAVIDTTNVNVTLNQPLLAPVGYGVSSIPLRSQGLGYIGAPTVVISGGSGTGATAIASVDLNESSPTFRQVTGLTVTSPGSGYKASDAVTVTLRGGGYTNSAAALAAGAVLSPHAAMGGLTKLGTGTLTLGGANTYGGATVISNGTVKLGSATALPTGTEVVLAGGTLDLNGFTATNTLTVFSGTLANGTLRTVLSPAGTNVVGTETVTLSGATLVGTYLADVTAAGACDLVQFTSGVNLSGLTLEIVDPEALNRTHVYTVATITGTRTGQFTVANLPDERWHVLYRANGNVDLVFVEGTLLMLQ